MTAAKSEVAVAVRLCPQENEHEKGWRKTGAASISGFSKDGRDQCYTFDAAYGQADTNENVFENSMRDLVDLSVDGFNVTIAAYGQSGSGKTHSLLGSASELGVLHMAIKHVFGNIEMKAPRKYLLTLSCIEVYNENVYDMLSEKEKLSPLSLFDKGDCCCVRDANEPRVSSVDEAFEFIEKAVARRRMSATELNKNSSRSHALFQLRIESCDALVASAFTVSRLVFVDLAGSENAKATTNAVQGLEGSKINTSLLALGTIISSLADEAEGRKSTQLSFRSSKLTRLMKSAFGGNSKTLMVCCINPRQCHETSSTLNFARQVKKVKNEPVKNESQVDSQLAEYLRKIEELEKKVAENNEMESKKKLGLLLSTILNAKTPDDAENQRFSRRHSIACFGGFKPNGLSFSPPIKRQKVLQPVQENDWKGEEFEEMLRRTDEFSRRGSTRSSLTLRFEVAVQTDQFPEKRETGTDESELTNAQQQEIDAELAALRNVLAEKELELASIQTARTEGSLSMQAVISERTALLQEKETLLAENQALKEKLENRKSEMEEARQLASSVKHEITSLADACGEMNVEMEAMQNEIGILQSKLACEKLNSEALRSANELLLNEQAKLIVASSECELQRQSLLELEHQRSLLLVKLAETNDKYEGLLAANAQQTVPKPDENLHHEERVFILESKLSEAVQQYDHLLKANEDQTSEIAVKQGTIEKLEEQSNGLKHEIASLQTKCVTFEEELKRSQLEIQVQLKKNEVVAANVSCELCTEKVARWREAVISREATETTNAWLKNELSVLKKKLEAQKDAAEMAMNRKKKGIQNMEEDLQTARDELRRVTDELTDEKMAREKAEKMKKDLLNWQSQSNQERRDLEEKLRQERLDTVAAQALCSCENIENVIAEKCKDLERALRTLDDVTKEKDGLIGKIESLEGQLLKARSKVTEASWESEKFRLETRNKDLEVEIKSLNDQLNEAQNAKSSRNPKLNSELIAEFEICRQKLAQAEKAQKASAARVKSLEEEKSVGLGVLRRLKEENRALKEKQST